jgi:hypothetical protein
VAARRAKQESLAIVGDARRLDVGVRPCDVVVSAHVSPSDRKQAFFSAIVARMLRRSRVDRASVVVSWTGL